MQCRVKIAYVRRKQMASLSRVIHRLGFSRMPIISIRTTITSKTNVALTIFLSSKKKRFEFFRIYLSKLTTLLYYHELVLFIFFKVGYQIFPIAIIINNITNVI